MWKILSTWGTGLYRDGRRNIPMLLVSEGRCENQLLANWTLEWWSNTLRPIALSVRYGMSRLIAPYCLSSIGCSALLRPIISLKSINIRLMVSAWCNLNIMMFWIYRCGWGEPGNTRPPGAEALMIVTSRPTQRQSSRAQSSQAMEVPKNVQK
jgi:hypothetical protein